LSTLPAVDSEEEVLLEVVVPDTDDESVVGGFFGGGCGFFTGTVVLVTSAVYEVDIRRSTWSIWVSDPATKEDAVKSNEATSSEYVLMVTLMKTIVSTQKENNVPNV